MQKDSPNLQKEPLISNILGELGPQNVWDRGTHNSAMTTFTPGGRVTFCSELVDHVFTYHDNSESLSSELLLEENAQRNCLTQYY